MRRKTLIIGQAQARTTVGKPAFSGKSGPRFAELLGVEHEKLWDVFDVVNLLEYFPGSDSSGDAFPHFEARRTAISMMPSLAGRRVVLVGKGVARAFGVNVGYFSWTKMNTAWDLELADACVVYHPSGRNRLLNSEANRKLALDFMRSIPR